MRKKMKSITYEIAEKNKSDIFLFFPGWFKQIINEFARILGRIITELYSRNDFKIAYYMYLLAESEDTITKYISCYFPEINCWVSLINCCWFCKLLISG